VGGSLFDQILNLARPCVNPEEIYQPTNMTQLLTNRRGINTNRAKQIEEIQDGVYTSFQQNSHPRLRCYYCGKQGHTTEVCEKKLEDKEKAAQERAAQAGSTSGGHTNTQGWFDEVNPYPSEGVSSFQYERATWGQED
jgi:hypothetical protein